MVSFRGVELGAFPTLEIPDEVERIEWSLPGRFCPIQTHQLVFAAEKQFPIRQNRPRPAGIMQRRYLPGAYFFGLFRVRAKQSQPATFTQHDEFAFRQDG